KAEHGIERVTDLVAMPVPDVYSAELSEYVLAAGLELLRRERPDVMYLSLTDYIQHKHPPGDPVARSFYAMLDRYFDAIDGEGAGPGGERLRTPPGVMGVWDRAEGCARVELPPDRVGDIILVGDRHTTLGKSPEAHDLSLLTEPLRSHGGPTEETVPFIINR